MKIALGMSGGVDSSVCAALLTEQGHSVTGVFLECWRSPGCRAEEDRKDALAVALKLGIPFQVLDFKDVYKNRVVEYFFGEYAAGRTPNPDVLCNKEIKFGLFYDWAMVQGFDAVATGHYAAVGPDSDGNLALRQPVDTWKDQTYFLYRLRSEQLAHILFPLGGYTKPTVREMATSFGLPVATKPDSQGICFIGEIDVHEFLKERLGEQPGPVVDAKGRVIGEHRGLWFYTIGQRHGFTYSVKPEQEGFSKHAMPALYVIGKRGRTNELVVGFGSQALQDSFGVTDLHWITLPRTGTALTVRIRHTGTLLPCQIDQSSTSLGRVTLTDATQGIAPGQSAVFYQDGICLGGGIIMDEAVL